MPMGNINGLYLLQKPAWHDYGFVAKEAHNSKEVMKIIEGDFEMIVRPQYYSYDDYAIQTPRYALVRKDNGEYFADVGPRYVPYQTWEAFDFSDSLVSSGEIVYETAGIMNGGRQVWILVRMPHVTEVTQDDIIHNYVMLISNNDGLGAIWFGRTLVRIVCQNTFNHAIRLARQDGKGKTFEQKTTWSIRHTSRTKENLEKAKKIFQTVNKLNEVADEQYRELAKTQIKREDFKEYAQDIVNYMYPPKDIDEGEVVTATGGISLLDAAIENTGKTEEELSRPAANMLDMILQNYDNEKNTLPGIAGTAWAAYNAVTEYTNHQISYRGRNGVGDVERYKAENRFNNLMGGKAADVNDYAYQEVMKRFRN